MGDERAWIEQAAARIRAHLAEPANRAAVVELLTGDTPEERRARRLAEAEAELAALREQGRYPLT